MRVFINSILITILLAFLTLTSFAQETASELIEQGIHLMQQQQLDQAEKALRRAISLDATVWEAYRTLGKIAMQRGKWGTARGYFKYLVKRRPSDLVARYNLAICYREDGKFRDPARRYLFWRRSRNHFQFVISKNIRFQDVLYQFAILQRYRGQFKAAVALAEQQVRLAPELDHVQIRLYRLYDYLLENSREKEVLAWLSHKKYPRAHYFIGELYRRNEKYNRADSLFTNLLATKLPYSRQPVLLSMVRLCVQIDKPRQAEKYFWQAVDSIKTNVDAALVFEDVKYIVNDIELQDYERVNTIRAKQQFFHKLWGQRDPMPAARENVRLIEHYRRLLVAEKYYRYDGFRAWINNPDKLRYLEFPKAFALNDKFNDKGMIYIRQGEPDEKAITMGPDEGHNESWLYYQRGRLPKMMFHFMIAEHGAGNNWRLTPILRRSWVQDRVTWDNIFHRYYYADELEMATLQVEMANKSKKDVNLGLTTDRHTWPKELQPIMIPFYTAVFQGEHGNNWLEFYYGIPRSYFQGIKQDSNPMAEAGLVIHDQAWNKAFQSLDNIDINTLQPDDFYDDVYIGQWRASVKPDVYAVAMHFKIKGTYRIGGYRFQQNMFDYRSPRLALSSIELAYVIEQSNEQNPFVKNGLKVIPNPTKSFKRNEPVDLYYEIYHLKKDNQGKTSFTVEHKVTLLQAAKQGLINKVLGLFEKSQQEISITTEREGGDETSFEYLALDLSSFKPGKYRLTVAVQDRNTDQSVDTSTEFELF